MKKSLLSIIIPCYFNEENIPVTFKEIYTVITEMSEYAQVECVFVDDGSKDNTYKKLLEVQSQYPDIVKVVKLARNFGANNAALAGMNYASGDCCIFLAADLQDPPELIPKMFNYWRQGIKVVVANRQSRKDPPVSKFFASIYHFFMQRFVIQNAVPGGGDLWLLDRSAIDTVIKMDEKNTALPYLFQWLGFDYINIPYERRKREIGVSRWTFSKKVKSFIDSFVSFTFLPIRIISIAGMLFGFFAIAYALILFFRVLINGTPLQGWSSLMIVNLFTSSFIMISIGILGEYIWRTLDASRKRPNFIVDKVVDNTKKP